MTLAETRQIPPFACPGRHACLRRLFAVTETVLAVVLLVGAGLLIRTFVNLRAQELGFDPSNVIVAKMSLIAHSVAQRVREVGIRMAIGATHGRVVLVFMKEGLALIAIGGLIGVSAAAVTSRLLRAIIFGIRPLDPTTFVLGAALLIAVTGLAALVPALRAARVDPMIALRTE